MNKKYNDKILFFSLSLGIIDVDNSYCWGDECLSQNLHYTHHVLKYSRSAKGYFISSDLMDDSSKAENLDENGKINSSPL